MALPTVSTPKHCPDCPAARESMLEELVSRAAGCAFRCAILEARETVSPDVLRPGNLVMVRRGILIRQRLDRQGRVAAVDAIGPGGIARVDPAPNGSSTATGYAATRLILCVCPAASANEALKNDENTANELVRAMGRSLTRIERLAEARGRPSARAQVASILCVLADTLASSEPDRVPSGIQQRDIAHLLGIRHETVCRVLRALENEGLLVRENEEFRIVDRAAIEAA